MDISRREFLVGTAGVAAAMRARGAGGAAAGGPRDAAAKKWYRGNMHAHTIWSDGQAFPDEAIAMYEAQGYDFVALSDHNSLGDDPDYWLDVGKKYGYYQSGFNDRIIKRYRAKFGDEVDSRVKNGVEQIRIKTYRDCAKRFNKPGQFLVLPGVESSLTIDGYLDFTNIHTSTIGLETLIPDIASHHQTDFHRKVRSPVTIAKQHYRDCAALAKGTPYLLTLNHPFWRYYDITVDEMLMLPEYRHFEICNGSGGTTMYPAAKAAAGFDEEKFWDVVLAHRAKYGLQPLFGHGSDDAHWYSWNAPESHTALAWNMVRASGLSQAELVAAMDAGDFYASCGVYLEDVAFDAATRTLRVKVRPEAGVTYKIRFITTRRGFDESVRWVDVPSTNPNEKNDWKRQPARRLPVYADDIGVCRAETAGVEAAYTMTDEDLYVRAVVVSSKPYRNPHGSWAGRARGFLGLPAFESAWVQPQGMEG